MRDVIPKCWTLPEKGYCSWISNFHALCTSGWQGQERIIPQRSNVLFRIREKKGTLSSEAGNSMLSSWSFWNTSLGSLTGQCPNEGSTQVENNLQIIAVTMLSTLMHYKTMNKSLLKSILFHLEWINFKIPNSPPKESTIIHSSTIIMYLLHARFTLGIENTAL